MRKFLKFMFELVVEGIALFMIIIGALAIISTCVGLLMQWLPFGIAFSWGLGLTFLFLACIVGPLFIRLGVTILDPGH